MMVMVPIDLDIDMLRCFMEAAKTGMGLSILPKGALIKGLKKAPSHLELPELPMYSLALITDEQRENDARDVFIEKKSRHLRNDVPYF